MTDEPRTALVAADHNGPDLSLGGELVVSSENQVTIRIGTSQFSVDRRDVRSMVHSPGPGNYAVVHVSATAQLIQHVAALTGPAAVKGVFADGPTCNCACACACACNCACACACSVERQIDPEPVSFRVALR